MQRGLRIDLVFDSDCPNVALARENLAAALREVGALEEWTEWDRASASTPKELRDYGSPTILVNGRDVASDASGRQRADAKSCRVYFDASHNRLAGDRRLGQSVVL